MSETCATCRFSDPNAQPVTYCCRYPDRRETYHSYWCGEHQPREAEPKQPKAREPGPYWVSPKRWNNWVVAHASIQPGTWFLPGEEAPVGDEDMLEIDERRIVRDAGS